MIATPINVAATTKFAASEPRETNIAGIMTRTLGATITIVHPTTAITTQIVSILHLTRRSPKGQTPALVWKRVSAGALSPQRLDRRSASICDRSNAMTGTEFRTNLSGSPVCMLPKDCLPQHADTVPWADARKVIRTVVRCGGSNVRPVRCSKHRLYQSRNRCRAVAPNPADLRRIVQAIERSGRSAARCRPGLRARHSAAPRTTAARWRNQQFREPPAD